MNKLVRLFIAIGLCELIGIAATPFTIAAIPTWYATLTKPPFSPPNSLFGPVWTILYALMGVAAFLVWEKGIRKLQVKKAMWIFFVQLALNFLWSLLFFDRQSPFLALIDSVALLVAIGATIIMFHKISKPASYLLIPYFLWVGFATYLNYSIWILNR